MEQLNVLTLAERITDEDAAYHFLEDLRWDDKPICPHCGVIGGYYFLTAKNGGRKTRTGALAERLSAHPDRS